MLDAEWLNCLTSAAGTTAKLKGYDDPSTLQMALGSEAPQIATRIATLPKEARRLLSLRLETEKVVIVEARRCAAKTDHFDRFTELRSASLATVLADDKVKDALDFDIDQIRVPLDG